MLHVQSELLSHKCAGSPTAGCYHLYFQHWRQWINDESIGGDIHQLTSSSCLSPFLRVQLIKIACFIGTEFSCTSPKGESKLLFWFIERFSSWIQIRNLFCSVVYNVQAWFEKPEVKYLERWSDMNCNKAQLGQEVISGLNHPSFPPCSMCGFHQTHTPHVWDVWIYERSTAKLLKVILVCAGGR